MNKSRFLFPKFFSFLGVFLFLNGFANQGYAAGDPKISFLTAQESRTEIANDKVEPYFKTLQPLEMSTKTGALIAGSNLDEMQAECIRRYQEAALDFTAEEKELLTWTVNQISPLLQKSYPLFAQTPWSFIKLSDQIEGGLPYTRGEHIVLTRNLLSTFQMGKKSNSQMVLMEFGSLLVHEQTHVFQRSHPELFSKLYIEVWGFKRVPQIESCPWLVDRHLSNPDGVECCWIFPIKNGQTTNWILPLVIFGNKPPGGICKMPEDFQMIGLELEEKDGYRVKVDLVGKPVFKELTQTAGYIQKFPGTNELYHPNELSADYFSQIVMFDAFAPKNRMDKKEVVQMEKTFAPLRNWFAGHFK